MARVCSDIKHSKGRGETFLDGRGGGECHGGSTSESNMTDPLATTQRQTHQPTPFSLPQTDEGVVMQALYVVVTPLLSGVDKEWRRFFRRHFDLEYASRESPPLEMEECLREVLLECGYGETPQETPCLAQEEGASSQKEHGEGDSGRKETSSKNLSGHGNILLAAALNLYSVLAVHGCCCLTAPPAAGKTTVWRVSILRDE